MARRRIEGLRMLITGASSGIGQALAEEAAAGGARVALAARSQDRLKAVADRIVGRGGEAVAIVADVTVPADRERMLHTAARHFAGLDVLVNNAGVGASGHFFQASQQRLRQIMEVNFFAVAETMRLAIPILQQGRSPLIVNIGSVLGRRAVPARSEYCASKFALTGLSEALRAEFVRFGIGVLVVQPGLTETPFQEHMIENRAVMSLHAQRAMPADRAAKIILRAIEKGKHEVVTTLPGKLLVALNRFFPRLVDFGAKRMAIMAIRREQELRREAGGGQPPANGSRADESPADQSPFEQVA